MSSTSNIFTKSNLVYIPLSITIAHILNFIINSSSSTWPPALPNSVYSSIFFAPMLLFISLSFEPIQTKKRFYTLLSLALLSMSIPIIYRGNKNPLHNVIVSITSTSGMKMLNLIGRTIIQRIQKNLNRTFGHYLIGVLILI
ncbi:hypothetical protein RhiirA5_419380 [Rhizophagus irregularis]|uniref:Uncharacterized protein n=1 Tax=Rhizophagus irregularis TaxID=588596 RepID=A0A2I1EQ60_9GLOM|nr:hypothetical protein RhiirA5_423270 [Rhizophagus irregularis]PKC06585.1 hypothetical protein RhiirA5_419380 [Rhizophagus irregularis]PKC72249.1 hypothetical protein RhiirA1_452570 [Rhizophagus irregularis]PKY24261.1 hypothetical protein RhiirB3_438746 [Rhizophagus irregularis]CAB4488675.1 unnamed protein product [Rhizophagus irregularis]